METAAQHLQTTAETLEEAFYPHEADSPLLTASFTPGNRTPVYAFVPSGNLVVAEAKARSKWKKGPTETEADRSVRLEAQVEKTRETHEKVKAGLEALSQSLAQGKSEQLLSLLDSMSCFHRYSWGNTILIMLQSPDSKLVAGFSTWKEQGRFVKAGEKGIAILAPIPKRFRVEGEAQPQPDETEATTAAHMETASGVWGFKVVFVFDVSQTDGQPLPKLTTVQGDPAHFLARLKESVHEEGIPVAYLDDLDGAYGRSYGGRIEMRNGLSPAQEFSSLTHEYAHELLHPKAERAGLTRAVRETEAEAVAYVVNRAIGLETGTASSDYIQVYQGTPATLAASLERIQKTASYILSKLEEPGTGPGQAED